MVIVTLLSKVCIFSENNSFTRNDIIITISFLNLSTLETVKTQRKVCGFDENDMETYSCKWSLNLKLHYARAISAENRLISNKLNPKNV